jgi:hypothetical protein
MDLHSHFVTDLHQSRSLQAGRESRPFTARRMVGEIWHSAPFVFVSCRISVWHISNVFSDSRFEVLLLHGCVERSWDMLWKTWDRRARMHFLKWTFFSVCGSLFEYETFHWRLRQSSLIQIYATRSLAMTDWYFPLEIPMAHDTIPNPLDHLWWLDWTRFHGLGIGTAIPLKRYLELL